METKCMTPACKISNIKFTVQKRQNSEKINKITFRRRKNSTKEGQQPNTQMSMIRKHIQSFLPVSFCNPKKPITAVKFTTCHREIKPLKGLQLTYKRFPIRKTLSSSAISVGRKQKNFCMGPQNNIVFSNKLINESIISTHKTERKTPDNNRAGSAYSKRRRSLPCTYEIPLTAL